MQDAITSTADLHARSIRVRMNNGTAHLSGHVPSSAALQIALTAAETAPGVTAVNSEIIVTAPEG